MTVDVSMVDAKIHAQNQTHAVATPHAAYADTGQYVNVLQIGEAIPRFNATNVSVPN